MNSRYFSDGQLQVEQMGARPRVARYEHDRFAPRKGSEFAAVLKLEGAEEIALRSGFITLDQMEPWLATYAKYVREMMASAALA